MRTFSRIFKDIDAGAFIAALYGYLAWNQPNAYAAIRNLVTGAFRRAGYADTAHARRYYGRDDQRILALYGYT